MIRGRKIGEKPAMNRSSAAWFKAEGVDFKVKTPRRRDFHTGSSERSTMSNQRYDEKKNKSTPKLQLVKAKPNVRLGGTLPTEDMAADKYLVVCENVWLEPVSKNTQAHRAAFQFRVVDGKYHGTALRMWIDGATDAGGFISPVGKYARQCEIALGRPLEDGDPVDQPAQIFAGRRFIVFAGYRKSDRAGGGGQFSDERAMMPKDAKDYLRVHEIISREDL
jgi:hypothetical protein